MLLRQETLLFVNDDYVAHVHTKTTLRKQRCCSTWPLPTQWAVSKKGKELNNSKFWSKAHIVLCNFQSKIVVLWCYVICNMYPHNMTVRKSLWSSAWHKACYLSGSIGYRETVTFPTHFSSLYNATNSGDNTRRETQLVNWLCKCHIYIMKHTNWSSWS